MGQAKRRGTYEQRKAAAMKQGRDKEAEALGRSKTEFKKLLTGKALEIALLTLLSLSKKR